MQEAQTPELPDLAVVVDALHLALAGRRIVDAQAPGFAVLRGTPAELVALAGQQILGGGRRGKLVLIELSMDQVVIAPMLTGRLALADSLPAPGMTAAGARRGGRPASRGPRHEVSFELSPRSGPPADAAAWCASATWLPPDDAAIFLAYSDPSHMGKVYLLPAGANRRIPGLVPPERGPDVDDPALDLEAWRERIRPHKGELKPLLRNQAFVAGIGNAYSDEILFRARLSPLRRRATLAPEEVDELYSAARDVITEAIEVLRKRVPPTFDKQVRDFLAVHRRGGEPCPRCGSRLTEIGRSEVTTYCRSCQR